MPGPQRTPTAILEARGSWRAGERKETEPDAGGELPFDPPSYLSKDAKQEWHRLRKLLTNQLVAGRIDAHALAIFCQEYCRWKDAERGLMDAGLVVKLSNGVYAENPYLKIAQKSALICHKLMAEFGMTPASRSRVTKREEVKTPKKLGGLTLSRAS